MLGTFLKKHTDLYSCQWQCRERGLRMKWILFYAYILMCTATMGDGIIMLMLVPSTTHMSTWRDDILYCQKIFYLWVINGVATYYVTPHPFTTPWLFYASLSAHRCFHSSIYNNVAIEMMVSMIGGWREIPWKWVWSHNCSIKGLLNTFHSILHSAFYILPTSLLSAGFSSCGDISTCAY